MRNLVRISSDKQTGGQFIGRVPYDRIDWSDGRTSVGVVGLLTTKDNGGTFVVLSPVEAS
jgi:hypothetical protein